VNEREKVAWLARRAGFGLAPGELDRLEKLGSGAYLDMLVAPDRAGVPTTPDMLAGLTFGEDNAARRDDTFNLIDRWLASMHAAVRPLEEMMTWFWHDHFAVSIGVVQRPKLMADHLGLLRRHALGDFGRLVSDVTVDAAMLIFLDGAKSTRQAPNENYGRELLELYTVGIGNFTEADVRAAAVALTGWTIRLREGATVVFDPRRHDSTAQTLLGRSVNDAASVVATAVANAATPRFIAAKVAAWFLGPDVGADAVDRFASTFRAGGLQLEPLVRSVLQAGLDGQGGEIVLAPVPWLAGVQRSLGVRLETRAALRILAGAGQVPLSPPNVGGWPGASAWLGASSTAARLSLAAALVDRLPASSPVLAAAAAGDLVRLADLLGRPTGFSAATRSALADLAASRPGDRAGAAMLAVALASPDLVVA
jgi:uncharacterized protein (DUF1800 family)